MAYPLAFHSLLTTCFYAVLVSSQSSFFPARPPAIPLAIRSPYLSSKAYTHCVGKPASNQVIAWQAAGSDGGNGGYLPGQWPSFWNGALIGWTGFIKVDGFVYTWLGNPNPLPATANQTSFSYTSTRSIFTLDVGSLITMNVTFMSPVTPHDMLRQSFPVSYMDVEVKSADGSSHEVQLYTDTSAGT